MNNPISRSRSAANRGRIHPSGTGRRLAGRKSGYVLHIKLQQFLAKKASRLIQPLSIRTLLG